MEAATGWCENAHLEGPAAERPFRPAAELHYSEPPPFEGALEGTFSLSVVSPVTAT